MYISIKSATKRRAFSGVKYILFFLLLSTAMFLLTSCGPDKITVSPITISPTIATPGQTVSVSINVLNLEKKAIPGYLLNFSVKGVLKETKTATLEAGQTTTFSFDFVPDTIGSYPVDVNSQTGTFTVVRPANFITGEMTISLESPVLGQEIVVTANITNDGDLPGKYNASYKLDGANLKTGEFELNAGDSASFSANFTPNTSGLHVIEFGGVSKTVKVLKPAAFKATSINVSPASILIGESATVTATITNEGEVNGTVPVAVKVNGTESSSKTVTLDPGTNTTVDFTVNPTSTGNLNIRVLESSTILNVIELKTYQNLGYFYEISYPPDFEVKQVGTSTMAIEKEGIGGITVLVDRVPIASTPKEYLNGIEEGKKKQLSDWAYGSLTEVQENGAITGYKYDYTNTINGVKWIGKGMVVKKGCLGFYVVFTTKETDWDKYKGIAPLIIDSFISPNIFVGNYANPAKGIALTLASEWSALESDSGVITLVLVNSKYTVAGVISSESILAGMTTQRFTDEIISNYKNIGLSLVSNISFKFDNSSTGYETIMTGMSDTGQLKLRMITQVNGNKGFLFLFIGKTSEIDTLANDITQMAKSLVISSPGSGLNKNETITLLEGEVPTLDPALTEEAADGITGAIFSGLVRIDNNLQVVPDLAESWSVSNDGTVYTFHLRKDAKFHSGKQVTAVDVKYSWERTCDPALKAPKAVYFLNDIVGAKDRMDGKATEISGIKIIDDYTLEVTIDAAKQYFLQKLAQPIAYIVNSSNVAKGTNWYETPDGTGPFALKSWVKDSQIILERYDNFYEGPVKLKNIVFKIFAGIPMTLYESGEIDITGVYLSDQDRVLNPSDPLNKQLLTGTVSVIDYIALNVTKPPFDDVKVRKAFAMALDVNKLLEISLKGKAERAAGYIPEGVPGYNPSLQATPFDVAQAKQLISESKYQSVDNFPEIKFYVLYSTGPTDEAIIGMWQQNLGVKITVETISEIKTYFDRMRNHEFQVFSTGWRADYIDPQNFLEVLFRSKSTENHCAYSNAQVDEQLTESGIDNNEESRIQKYQEIEKQILEDMPAIPLFRNSKEYVLAKPWVKGYKVLPLGVGQWRYIYVEAH